MKYVTAAWSWLKDKWAKFEAWVDSWMPAYKSLVINGLTGLGTGATALAAYIKEVPLETFITANKLAVITVIVCSLSFWLRGIGDRVETREA